MANPIFIDCPKNQWTKIATNISAINVHKVVRVTYEYLFTTVLTGGVAPTTKEEGVEAFEKGSLQEVYSSSKIDVYLFAITATGRVRVDDGLRSEVETNGALAVNIQDQHSRTFDLFFSQLLAAPTTLAAPAVLNAYSFEASPGHGILVGEQLVMRNIVVGRAYVCDVLSVVTNTIGLDRPINENYPVAETVIARTTKELNVDGSSTRQTFIVTTSLNVELDITRIMFQMITTDFPELDMFGDIAGGITRGLVFRVVNGLYVNYFNVKDNAELANIMYDVTFYEAAKHGVNGLAGRLTYGGQSKHGVTIRIGPNERLEVIVQDDLLSILNFRILAAGHAVTD